MLQGSHEGKISEVCSNNGQQRERRDNHSESYNWDKALYLHYFAMRVVNDGKVPLIYCSSTIRFKWGLLLDSNCIARADRI